MIGCGDEVFRVWKERGNLGAEARSVKVVRVDEGSRGEGGARGRKARTSRRPCGAIMEPSSGDDYQY